MFVGAIYPAYPGAYLYASRTVIAPKKNCSIRMCVDYLDVTAQTKKDSFFLQQIDQVWLTLLCAKYFVFVDLLIGFNQVEVDPRDRVKTAYLTDCGLYVYNVMPFCLCNAPVTFQRLIKRVLKTMIGLGVHVQINDV